jgi:hypothetical protein
MKLVAGSRSGVAPHPAPNLERTLSSRQGDSLSLNSGQGRNFTGYNNYRMPQTSHSPAGRSAPAVANLIARRIAARARRRSPQAS